MDLHKRARRVVAYDRQRRVYLGHDCCTETRDRTWAWSGNTRQARNMVCVFPLAEEFELFWDGDETSIDGRPIDVR